MNAQNVNTYEETFYIIPRYIRKLEGITLTFLDFFETIFQFWNKNKSCFLSNALIKKRTGIKSDSTINEAFQYFEKQGVMKRIEKDGRRYIVPVISEIETDSGVSLQREGGLATARGGVSLQRDINKEVINKKTNKENNNYVIIKESEKPLAPANSKIKNHPAKKSESIIPLKNLQEINSLNLSDDYLTQLIEIRKANKASINKQAMKAVYQELIKLKNAGLDLNECLSMYANCGWKGFVADWFIKTIKGKKNQYDFYTSDDTSWGDEMKNDPFFQGLLG